MARKLRVEYTGAIYHDLLTDEQPLRSFTWSSYGKYLQAPAKRPGRLRVDRLLGELGIPQDNTAGRRQFELGMEERRRRDEPAQWESVERGWCMGDEEFRQELLGQMEPKLGRHHGGPEREETAASRAERMLGEERKRRGWTTEQLTRRRKEDREKVRIARRLRKETTMTLEWIAQRLNMGAAG